MLSRKSFWLPLCVVTLASVAFSFTLMKRRAELFALRGAEAGLLTRLEEVSRQRAGLRDERDALLTDAGAIERVAREQYGFVAPGELVTPFEPSSSGASARPVVAVPSDGWERVLGRGGFPWMIPLGVCWVSLAVLTALECISGARQKGSR